MAVRRTRTSALRAAAGAIVLGLLWWFPVDSGVTSDAPLNMALPSRESLTLGTVIAWGYDGTDQISVPDEARSGVTAIAAGVGHALALKDGGVIAWGYDEDGQATVPEEAKSGVTAIAAGGDHSLALKAGQVIAWGGNDFGQVTVPEAAKSDVIAIAAGGWQSMALTRSGEVIAWGHFDALTPVSVPAEVKAGVSAIAAGGRHSLALKAGEVIGWGRGYFGGWVRVPKAAKSGVIAVAAGGRHSMALTRRGQVIAWGFNTDGQVTVPKAAKSGVTAIAAGGGHSLALKDGGVIAWGFNSDGQVTVPKVAKSRVAAIAAGGAVSFALRFPSSAAPKPPTAVIGVGKSGSVAVSWDMPPDSEPADSFIVTSAPDGSTCTASVPEQSCRVGGLTNGRTYTFTVVASNSFGSSPPSVPSPPVTPRGAPTAPTSVNAVAGNAAATVSWSVPASDGGYPVSGYVVESLPAGGACSTAGAQLCTVTGLANSVSYTFLVAARNQSGTSPRSEESSPVTPNAQLPTMPRLVTGVPGNRRVTVSWQPPSGTGGAPISGYTATGSPGGQSCTTTGELTCTVVGLVNGTPYTFTVTATNGAGSSIPSYPSGSVTPQRPS